MWDIEITFHKKIRQFMFEADWYDGPLNAFWIGPIAFNGYIMLYDDDEKPNPITQILLYPIGAIYYWIAKWHFEIWHNKHMRNRCNRYHLTG